MHLRARLAVPASAPYICAHDSLYPRRSPRCTRVALTSLYPRPRRTDARSPRCTRVRAILMRARLAVPASAPCICALASLYPRPALTSLYPRPRRTDARSLHCARVRATLMRARLAVPASAPYNCALVSLCPHRRLAFACHAFAHLPRSEQAGIARRRLP